MGRGILGIPYLPLGPLSRDMHGSGGVAGCYGFLSCKEQIMVTWYKPNPLVYEW